MLGNACLSTLLYYYFNSEYTIRCFVYVGFFMLKNIGKDKIAHVYGAFLWASHFADALFEGMNPMLLFLMLHLSFSVYCFLLSGAFT